jgi:hypothetical protein
VHSQIDLHLRLAEQRQREYEARAAEERLVRAARRAHRRRRAA